MAPQPTYEDLIFELGDVARERLARRRDAPRSMERVLRAEDTLVARQQELEDIEARMNEEDAAFKDFCAMFDEERATAQPLIKQWRKAVDAISGRIKDLRKKLSVSRTDLFFSDHAIKTAERRHQALEETAATQDKLEESRQAIKKLRITHMRFAKASEELEAKFNLIFDIPDSQPGYDAIMAYRRLLELEDEQTARKAQLEQGLKELNDAAAVKEDELQAAQDFLDQAVYLLGEECYAQRISDPALAAFYPRLDRAK